MKNRIAITAVSVLVLASISAVPAAAQTTASGEVNAGGLGKGLNSMVKNILGETQQSAPQPALMMQSNSAGDASFAVPPPPEARMKSLKATPESAMLMVAAPLSEEDLHVHIQDMLRADSRLQTVDTSDTHVRLTYAIPAKIFGIVPVTARVVVGAYISGKTEVSYPWYAFSSKKLSNEFKATVKTDIEPSIPSSPFTLEEQQSLIDRIYGVLSAQFGAGV